MKGSVTVLKSLRFRPRSTNQRSATCLLIGYRPKQILSFSQKTFLTLKILIYYEIMTVEAEKDKNKNRRTLSESELNVIPEEEETFQPKRCHSLPHRYKPNNLSFSSPKSSQRRPKSYTPEEFRRGMLALQSWFRNLDDNQRTLALHSITVRQFLIS